MMYKRLVEASNYYTSQGYKYVELPWEVDNTTSDITKPPECKDYKLNDGVLVASGEQSFLQLIIDDKLTFGKYQGITPCFRHEYQYDDMHKPYFMKLELIKYGINLNSIDLVDILNKAINFFNNYIECEVIKIANFQFDIVTKNNKIELGSYGYRQYKDIEWIYGTGLAEPRLTEALK